MSIALLSAEQKQVIYAVERGESIFITGGAGVGKSHLLRYLKHNYSSSGLNVVASTGVAAVNIGGQTLHSWAALGLGNAPLEQLISNLSSSKFSKIRRRIKLAKMLAIDEISMVSPKIFDVLNQLLKIVRQNERPFGGLQMILFGDFLQLPPVAKREEVLKEYQFCFQSYAWQELNPKNFVLNSVFRQSEQNFIKLLNNIRFGLLDEEDKNLLQSRMDISDDAAEIKATALVSHNSQVEFINAGEMSKINKTSHFFTAEFFGDENRYDFLRNNCLANSNLELKVGSQVMMLKNSYQKEGISNGSLGMVRDFVGKSKYPLVQFQNGVILTIAPEEWLLEKLDLEKSRMIVEAGMKQIPLLPAWAMTIHKSQGMTLDKISCDLSRVFADGQIYVALSRVRTLEGLYIKGLDLNKIRANRQLVDFYRNILIN